MIGKAASNTPKSSLLLEFVEHWWPPVRPSLPVGCHNGRAPSPCRPFRPPAGLKWVWHPCSVVLLLWCLYRITGASFISLSGFGHLELYSNNFFFFFFKRFSITAWIPCAHNSNSQQQAVEFTCSAALKHNLKPARNLREKQTHLFFFLKTLGGSSPRAARSHGCTNTATSSGELPACTMSSDYVQKTCKEWDDWGEEGS